ncbi:MULTISPECIES: Asp23/Gls24 family envelope stress response protein [Nesterenkonia]|uniref:Putative alkaline shock family protein YloU n=1 Tax=Nesterenkonia xinjiangensis TaxID=225327 RepID=A0A7Z0K7W4_9MICC|nr:MULTISPECIES: Asp23/Gls24 family envelope stress response protein [Nesterenkonia]MDZ5076966.1 Asp23/Gls24 family envelope stress response protein [Nesterenkonia sp. HG001]NYJ77031.1 putative alkaline shock family protein YloU [Nesterenkonia xinjiangensis]
MAENRQTATPSAVAQSSAGTSTGKAVQAPNDGRPADSPLVTAYGTTTVEETVVQKLAGIAAREIPGVYAMGNVARRTFDAISERIPGSKTQVSGGVSVEKGEKETAVDLTVIVEYGAAVVEVAENIRRNVIRSVEHGTGLKVVEVNITVADVHLPEDDDEGDDHDLA